MPDTKISALTEHTSPVGTEEMFGYNTLNSRMKLSTFRNYYNTFYVPAYISGRWYSGINGSQNGSTSAGAVSFVTDTNFMCFSIWQTVTISQLGCRITTTGTNVKLGIYANNNSTMKPTGTCLGSTANVDATSTGNKAAVISGGNIVLSPGFYWFAWGSDNTAVRFQGPQGNMNEFTNFVGTTTQGRAVAASGVGDIGWKTTEAAYGTFGDMTSATFSNYTGSLNPVFLVA